MSQWQEYWDDLADVLARHFDQKRVKRSQHAVEQAEKRGISWKSVQYVVEKYDPDEMYPAMKYPHGPNPYHNADPVFSITGTDKAGRWISVAVAVQSVHGSLRFTIVTVLEPSDNSRHRREH